MAEKVEKAETNSRSVASYKVRTRVKHDGRGYKPGATLKLTAAQAAPLLAHKSIEPARAAE